MSVNRLQSEAEHFDRVYAAEHAGAVQPVSEANIVRYRECPDAHLYGAERLFALAKPLEDRCVLEMGCGAGKNAINLAANGARVWAYDVSAEAVEAARQKARLNGFEDRITFAVATTPEEAWPGMRFDVVFGNLILHHLDFDSFDGLLPPLLKPGGKAVFREPVIRSKVLGALRKLIPWYPSDPTPDERPLTDGDIGRLAKPFKKCDVHYFEAFSRVWPQFRKFPRVVRGLHAFDAKFLRYWPGATILASAAVFCLSELTEPGTGSEAVVS